MTITNGPNLGLMVNGSAGEAHYSQFMALLRGLDGLVLPSVKGYLVNTPPGSPADGDSYIVGAAPTGAWAGKAGNVTRYSTVAVAWEFYVPKNGWMIQANSAREAYRYTGSAWEVHYQEGTVAITIQDNVLNSATMGAQNAFSFVRSGKMMLVSGTLDWTSTAALTVGSRIRLYGLPAIAATSSVRWIAAFGASLAGSFNITRAEISCSLDYGQSFLWMRKVSGNNVDGDLTKADIGSSGTLYGITIVYQTL